MCIYIILHVVIAYCSSSKLRAIRCKILIDPLCRSKILLEQWLIILCKVKISASKWFFNIQGWPTKKFLFSFGNNFYKNKETFKIFSSQMLKVYRIRLVQTTPESIMFYYTFLVANNMFFPCTALPYESTSAARGGNEVASMRWYLNSRAEHLNTSGITSHSTDLVRVKPITLGYRIPKISIRLTIFWGAT